MKPIGLEEMVADAIEKKASDIILARDKISFRVNGRLKPTGMAYEQELFEAILKAQPDDDILLAKRSLNSPRGDADFAITVGNHRLRVNLYKTRQGMASALRPLPSAVFAPADLGLNPDLLDMLLGKMEGLVLVTGPTGSGKSTTLNCMVDHINVNRDCHIITIEDPVEFIYTEKRATIEQREVGKDVDSFANAIRAAMRENPDVIVVGELRDYETAKAALEAAETGHLVFATSHMKRCYSTVSRLVGLAPLGEENLIRQNVANNLRMIVCQRLLPRANTKGRVAVREVLIHQTALATMIKERSEKNITGHLMTHRADGMMDYNTALKLLLEEGLIDQDTFHAEQDTM